jgi:hypothetical protein
VTFPFTAEDLRILTQRNTPTICNALELLVPERRAAKWWIAWRGMNMSPPLHFPQSSVFKISTTGPATAHFGTRSSYLHENIVQLKRTNFNFFENHLHPTVP